MTVETTVRQADFVGNGSTTDFPIPFPWQQDADLVVTLIDNVTLAETPQVLGVDYTLPLGAGTISMAVAPPSSKTVHVERVVYYVQTSKWVNNDGFDAALAEATWDRIVMMIQQVAETAGSGGGGGGGGGASYTLANIGSGQGVIAGLVGNQYQLRSLKATGTGLAISGDADSITYALSGVLLAAQNLADVANRQTALNGLTAVAGATNEFVLTKDTATGNALWKAVPTGGGGEANTSSSAGGTVALALAKVGVNLPFRGLTAGANVTLTPSGTDVTIAATGEANTISSVAATGSSIVSGKVGVDLRVKGLGPGTGISVGSSATDLTVGVNTATDWAWTGRHHITKNAGDLATTATARMLSPNNGAISGYQAHGWNILFTSSYETVLDIQKTTSGATASANNAPGGVHAIFVQHRMTGVANANARLYGGIRSHVDNDMTGQPTEATAFYGLARNGGNNANAAWAFFCDVVHDNSNASGNTRGFAAEMLRGNVAGLHTAFEAMTMDSSLFASDAAFIVKRQSGSAPKWVQGFALGNAFSGVAVDYGFDARYATVNVAALRLASGQLIRLAGDSTVGDIRHNTASPVFGGSSSAIELINAGSPMFAVSMSDGLVAFRNATGTLVGAAGGASAQPATPAAYLNVYAPAPGTGTMTAYKIALHRF